MIRSSGYVVGAVLCVIASTAHAVDVLPPIPTVPALSAILPGVSTLPSVPLAPLPRVKGGAFDLRFVNVGQLVDLLYGDAMHTPHVISSDVLQDQRVVSFQYEAKQGDLHAFVKVFLDSLGFQVDTKDGVDFVSRRPAAERVDPERLTFVYHPRYRPASYLAKLVQPLFQGRMSAAPAAVATPSSELGVQAPYGASQVMPTPSPVAAFGGLGGSTGGAQQNGMSFADELVFVGTESEIRDVKRVLPEVDRAAGEVVVRGWVYEVSDTDSKNSAFSIAAHVLDGQLGISNGQTGVDATALTFDAHFLSLAISALSADSRFKEVSDPHVRVLSGEKVSLNVGSQVPTLGSISYQGASGTPVQSVEYQDAGVIFAVQPTVMADAIQVKLDEQISSFVPTTSGVNNSPTKNTREMTTTVSMKDGEVVVLGGLVQDSDTTAVNSEGWLPRFLDGHSSSKGRTEVLLVLQVQRVDAS